MAKNADKVIYRKIAEQYGSSKGRQIADRLSLVSIMAELTLLEELICMDQVIGTDFVSELRQAEPDLSLLSFQDRQSELGTKILKRCWERDGTPYRQLSPIVRSFLLDPNSLDDLLSGTGTFFSADSAKAYKGTIDGTVWKQIVRYLQEACRQEAGSALLLSDPWGDQGREDLPKAAVHCGYNLVLVDLCRFFQRDGDLEQNLEDLALAGLLTNSLICFENPIGEPAGGWGYFTEMISRHLKVFLLYEKQGQGDIFRHISCAFTRIDYELPTPSERKLIWQSCAEDLGWEPAEDFNLMAEVFHFNRSSIEKTMRSAALAAATQGLKQPELEQFRTAGFQQIGFTMGDTAQKIDSIYRWNDLVADQRCIGSLKTACDRIRNRTSVYDRWNMKELVGYGRGVSMVFYGPPGTGKTMAAQIMAREIGYELYRVDLAQVSDKYVGETEKRLKSIFKNASQAEIMLFFDEADALFAKRTDVDSANDRYANSETAYLLQLIEEYEGVTVLATNLMGNFDEAFKRRMNYMIHFPSPDKEQRLLLWKRFLPEGIPKEKDLNLEILAERFELTGSGIRDVALNAAFKAAAVESSISMGYLITGIKEEFMKQGRVITDMDFY